MLFGFIQVGNAQVSALPPEVTGIWNQVDSVHYNRKDWQAKWIWMPDSIESDLMLARKTFRLTGQPESAEMRITASSKYELFINGQYICQGPARSAPHHQSFDVWSVSPVLKKGVNTIAIRVHHQKGSRSYHLQGRAGLLVQLDGHANDKTWSILSDKDWKVFPDLSWDNSAPAMNRFQSAVNDRVDMRKKIRNFQSVTFNDYNWLQARVLGRNTGWPAPQKNDKATTFSAPWTSLVQRDIPYLIENIVWAENLIEARIISSQKNETSSIPLHGSIDKRLQKNLDHFAEKGKPVVLPASGKESAWFVLFDFGKVLNGMPAITIEGEQNTRIEVLSAPFVIDNEFSHKIVDSEYKDQITLSGQMDRWRSMYFKPVRYLALLVKNFEPVKLHSIGIHQLQYPFKLKGSITTPEAPWIEELWHASAQTIDVCTTDALTDNYRERRQYAQTGYYGALGNYFTFGDYALQRRYLIQIAQEQQADGLMPAYAPLNKDDYMVILDSNCFYVRSLYNYFLYSGDRTTVENLLPATKKLMDLLGSYTNEQGMIDSPPYSYWLDHTINDRRGANLTLNGHYLGALLDFSKILEWLNEKELSASYRKKADSLRSNLRRRLWDDNRKLYADALVDGQRSDQFSEHGNAMALALDIATQEQAKQIARQLLTKDNHNYIYREDGTTMVSPAMSYWLHKGLAYHGNTAASLNMLKDRFQRMTAPETNGTLWEEWWRNGTGRTGEFKERTRSDAQTESVFPPALFAEFVLGFQVTKPGFEEILVSEPRYPLSKISGTIPSPVGNISMNWIKKDKLHLNLIIPNGVTAKIDTSGMEQYSTIKSRKKNSMTPVVIDDSSVLTAGEYEITFE